MFIGRWVFSPFYLNQVLRIAYYLKILITYKYICKQEINNVISVMFGLQKLCKFPEIFLNSVEIHTSQMAHVSVQQASAQIIRRTLNKTEYISLYKILDRTDVLYSQNPFGNIWLHINFEFKKCEEWMWNDRLGRRHRDLSGRVDQHACISWDRLTAASAGGHDLNPHPYLGRQNSPWILFQQSFRMEAHLNMILSVGNSSCPHSSVVNHLEQALSPT